MIALPDLSSPISYGGLFLFLSLLPVLVLMVTPFLKLSIVFGALRIGFGSQGVPGPAVVGAMALLLSLYSAEPTLRAVLSEIGSTVSPNEKPNARAQNTNGSLKQWKETANRILAPLAHFLKQHSGAEELQFFKRRSKSELPEIMILIPAFVLTELRSAFSMALYLFVPFLIVDLLVTTILTGMGMMMVNPVTIAFPLKLLLFVSCDGWLRLSSALLEQYRV